MGLERLDLLKHAEDAEFSQGGRMTQGKPDQATDMMTG